MAPSAPPTSCSSISMPVVGTNRSKAWKQWCKFLKAMSAQHASDDGEVSPQSCVDRTRLSCTLEDDQPSIADVATRWQGSFVDSVSNLPAWLLWLESRLLLTLPPTWSLFNYLSLNISGNIIYNLYLVKLRPAYDTIRRNKIISTNNYFFF